MGQQVRVYSENTRPENRSGIAVRVTHRPKPLAGAVWPDELPNMEVALALPADFAQPPRLFMPERRPNKHTYQIGHGVHDVANYIEQQCAWLRADTILAFRYSESRRT